MHPRDYNSVVAERLKEMGYTRLHLCSCIFIYEFRERANTTEPEWNQSNLLGMVVSRRRDKRAICLSDGGFIVREDDLED